jgi:formate dehydrogenase major subunit
VLHYTNAATIITDKFADTEDLDGLFSGFDPEERSYDVSTWQYEGTEVQAASGERDQEYEDRAPARKSGRGESHGSGGAHVGPPKNDPTLQHPRCVFQILKRHFARHTPEMVEQICGVPQDTFRQVCELVTENSGRDRTTAFAYSVGWTQPPCIFGGDGSASDSWTSSPYTRCTPHSRSLPRTKSATCSAIVTTYPDCVR